MTVITATTQLPADWAGLLKGYLYYVTKSYGGPAMQNFVLGGPLLSANAGGYIAKRNVHDWLYGAAMSHAACIWCSSHRSGLPSVFLVAQQHTGCCMMYSTSGHRGPASFPAGWVDPLLASGAGCSDCPAAKMSLTSAWETREAPMQVILRWFGIIHDDCCLTLRW